MSSTRGTSEGNRGTSSEDISYDDCFDLLSNHRRRYALHYLKENGDAATLGELSDQIAAWENDIEVDEVSYDERKRVYTSLQQVHLPRMDDMEVVEFDDREGTVEVGPVAEELDIYLEVVQGRDIPWSTFYLGLAALNGLLIVGALLGLPLLTGLDSLALAVFVVTTFVVTSLAHAYINRTEMHLDSYEAPPEVEK
jgi:hypothetical protein